MYGYNVIWKVLKEKLRKWILDLFFVRCGCKLWNYIENVKNSNIVFKFNKILKL